MPPSRSLHQSLHDDIVRDGYRTAARRRARRLRVLAMLAALAGAVSAFCETSEPSSALRFDIPEQPLIEALQAYSRASGVQVMFETSAASRHRSAAVEGELTADGALRALLANTDLKIRYVRAGSVTLAPASASAPDADAPSAHTSAPDLSLATLNVNGPVDDDRERLDEYVGAVRTDIQRALKRLGKLRRGDYRVEVKLWIDPSRTVQRAELGGTTGSRERDDAIVDALRGLVVTRGAPANTPHPIRFMIVIRSL